MRVYWLENLSDGERAQVVAHNVLEAALFLNWYPTETQVIGERDVPALRLDPPQYRVDFKGKSFERYL